MPNNVTHLTVVPRKHISDLPDNAIRSIEDATIWSGICINLALKMIPDNAKDDDHLLMATYCLADTREKLLDLLPEDCRKKVKNMV